MLETLGPFRHAVNEFPTACVQTLIATLRQDGFAGLLRTPIETAMHLSMIAAWALGRLAADDPVIFGDDPANETLAAELCGLLETEGNLRPQPLEGPLQNVITRRLLALAMTYLHALLSDTDQIQDLAEWVLDWLKEQLA